MRVQVLQHVPFEGLGAIAPWLADRGAAVGWTRFHEAGAVLPADAAGLDLIIALGGPMSVHDAPRLPWLAAEQRWLGDAARAGRPVLGLCLGAQQLAAALGAPVTRAPEREIGWFAVESVAQGPDLCPLPGRSVLFHWHGETFGLPAGAVHLARSAACFHQGFQWGRRAVGLQFHPEATPAALAAMVAHEGHELVPGRWVQDAGTILAADPARCAAAEAVTAGILDFLAG